MVSDRMREYWQDSDGVDDNPVSVSITHWMPLPKLPEVER